MRIPLAKPIFDEEMKKTALDALENERFVMGESVYGLSRFHSKKEFSVL
jgi:hypothetical protein